MRTDKRRQEILQQLYEGVDTPYGMNKLQRILTRDYIGVTQKNLRDFLHTHESWQLKKPTRSDVKQRAYLLHTKPGFLEIDYTFREHDTRGLNDNKNYILTCIDRFSRYAWVIPRHDKTAKGTRGAFERICNSFKKLTGSFPHAVLSDNGKELDNKLFDSYWAH